MKILIAYDGSKWADTALSDLCHAGLPDEVEGVILTVGEVHASSPVHSNAHAATDAEGASIEVPIITAHAGRALQSAQAVADKGSNGLRKLFQHWNIQTEVYAGSPIWGIVGRADSWEPDMLVVGSHGHSFFGRLFMGSISQTVVTEARCSVRVGRGREHPATSPVRLIIGVDGSPNAQEAVRVVASRTWPAGSSARIVAALDPIHTTTMPPPNTQASIWDATGKQSDEAWIEQSVNDSMQQLHAAGLLESCVVKRADPKHLLLHEAEHWGADSIFIGARGINPIERFLLGSVSRSVAARAHCSVEVVREGGGKG